MQIEVVLIFSGGKRRYGNTFNYHGACAELIKFNNKLYWEFRWILPSINRQRRRKKYDQVRNALGPHHHFIYIKKRRKEVWVSEGFFGHTNIGFWAIPFRVGDL